MSDFEQRPNSGSLFPNDRKTKQNHPDRQGSALVECPACGATSEFWLSAWVKPMRQKAANWLSLAFTAKDEQPQPTRDPGEQAQPVADSGGRSTCNTDFDDDIPF